MKVEAQIVDLDDQVGPPGAIELVMQYDKPDTVAGLAFICPCGCGMPGYLPLAEGSPGPKWQWDGNREKPTLTPSVQQMGGCRWHGYLTAGAWVLHR